MIVLDTHALIWWVDRTKKLSDRAKNLIESERSKSEIAISAISIWEICLLVQAEDLTLSKDIDSWISDLLTVPRLQVIPVDSLIAKASVFLPSWSHKDPADRIIVATALHLGVPLVTGDQKIRRYKHVQTIW